MAKLGDIATIQSGGTPARSISKYWNDGTIPWVKISDIKSKHTEKTEEKITEAGLENSSAKIFPKGTILYTIFATLGETTILDIDAATNQAIVGIGLTSTDVLPDFLYYYLLAQKGYVQKVGRGVAQNNINLKILRDFDVPVLSKEKQLRVIDELNRVSELIELRKQQLSALDTLIKARFAEMFMQEKYPTKTLDEVSNGKGEYGAQSASMEYDVLRPRYVRITDVNDDGTLNDDKVSSSNMADDVQYQLSYGDFLFARMGATVGKTYAFLKGNQIYAGYLIRYKLNLSMINPRYLFWYTKLDEYQTWVKLSQSGAAQPGINAKKYGSLQIPLPPLELQNDFAAFVEQVDKSRLLHNFFEKTLAICMKCVQNRSWEV